MLQIGFKTHKGQVRSHNEDACFIIPEHNIYVVADGVGGNSGGEIASRTAVYEITQFVHANPLAEEATASQIKAYFTECLSKVNDEIYKKSDRRNENSGMATTVVVCCIRGGYAYIAHVGDSRAYICKNGALTQITEDHTYVNALVKAGIISAEEAVSHEQRHMITRALGAEEAVSPDFKQVEIRENDIILLCTDGLFGEVEEPLITEILSSSRYTMSEMAGVLVDEANKSGGADNITVICLRI